MEHEVEQWENEGGLVVDDESLLTPGEVAALFKVDPKTVTRWAKAGKLESFRTLGGHRRYRRSDIEALIKAGDVQV